MIYNNGAAGAAGINLDGVQDSLIQNNLIYNEHATGIVLYQGDGGGPSKNNIVVNNTVEIAADGRWCLLIGSDYSGGAINNRVENNILINLNTSRGAINIDSASLPGFVSNNNVETPLFTIDDGGTTYDFAGWQALGYDQQSYVAPDEANLFVDAANGNYKLQSGSVAVGNGTANDAPIDDLTGRARPGTFGIDIGAYQT